MNTPYGPSMTDAIATVLRALQPGHEMVFFWENGTQHVKLLVDGALAEEAKVQQLADGIDRVLRVHREPPPLEGDVVTAIGGTQRMTVLNSALGNFWEGIDNGVLCGWTDDEGERAEVYRPSSLVVVQRALDA